MTTPDPRTPHYLPLSESESRLTESLRLPHDSSPPPPTRLSPPWNGFDTFLRRGVMIAAFIILWTTIAAGLALVIGGAALISNLSDNGGSSSTVDPTFYGPAPTVDPNGECIGEVPC